MKNHVYIKTFGCQMNGYDSARMAEMLASSHGYEAVDDPLLADLIVLNTCHVREKAEEKLFSELGRLRRQTRGREVVFAVGGCVGQAAGEQIFQRAPYVDLVFGPQNYHHLPQMLDRLARGEGRQVGSALPTDSKFDTLLDGVGSGAIAQVTVQEGCDRFCTYCVVPFTRGRAWSRSVEEVVREVTGVVQSGAVELVLLGQNVNSYSSLDRDGVLYDLPLLLRRIALIDGVRRIRFITSHPADMSDDLVEVFGDLPSLCPYLHLPIQSGSDRILTLMERGHTVADYRAWVAKVRQVCPDVALASDFIVGFPGETEADFQETLDLIQELAFAHAFFFKYSARPGSAAASMTDTVPDAVASERLERLQRLLDAQRLEENKKQIGRVEAVLVEGVGRDGALHGRTPGMRVIHFPGDSALIGTIVPVTITEALGHSLRGVRSDKIHG